MDAVARTKIVRISRAAQYLSLLFLLGTPLLYALLLYNGELSVVLKLPKNVVFDESALTLFEKGVAALIPLISLGVYMLLFQKLYRLFGLFVKGAFFTPDTAASVLYIGYLLVLVDFAKTVESLVASLLLSAMGAIQNGLVVNVGFSMLIVGVFIVIMGHIWKIALEMYENERLTV